jgi:tetratricopeptide (TPR) repeat protein
MSPDVMGGWDVWGPPTVVLVLGIVIGVIIAMRSRGESGTPADAGRRDGLLARKDTLMEQIRGLDAERGKLSDAEIATRREALITEAATALREAEAPDLPTAPTGPPPNMGARIAWAVVVVGFFVAVGFGLTEFTAPKDNNGMGGMGGGGAPSAGGGGGSGGATPSLRLEAAQKAIAENPDDLGALNDITYETLLSQDFAGAMTHLDKARTMAPEDPDVLIHLSILQLTVGMADRAAPALLKAAELQPNKGKPRLWLGLQQLQMGENAAATASLQSALDMGLRPDETMFARQFMMEAMGAGTAPPSAPPSPDAAGAGEGAVAVAGQPPNALDTTRLSGSISLAAGVPADVSQRVFLIVHRNEAGAGPPLAVRPLEARDLPLDFALTDNDQMMKGQPWPEQVWVFARLDADGKAGSSDGDVESQKFGPLPIGTGDVALVIGG